LIKKKEKKQIKTRAINGQGSRQTSRRVSINRDDRFVGFDQPKIDECLSNCAEDNPLISNNIPCHREEDLQREHINSLIKNFSYMLARSWVGGDLSEFEWKSKKCIAIVKVFERKSGRSGFNVGVSSWQRNSLAKFWKIRFYHSSLMAEAKNYPSI
jgi:hypothetical protein